MRKKNDPSPKSMRVDDELWKAFKAACDADEQYPRRMIEALMIEYQGMSEARKKKLRRTWGEWWVRRM